MTTAVLQRGSWVEGLLAAHPTAPESSRRQLLEQGLPAAREETWRFTDLAPLLALDPARLQPRAGADGNPNAAKDAAVVRLQLDGRGTGLQPAAASAPLPQGLKLEPTPLPLPDAALLSARLHGLTSGPCLQLSLAANAQLQLELWLEPAGADALLAPRLLLDLGEGAQLQLAVHLRCNGSSLALPWVEAQLAPGAELTEAWLFQGDATDVLLSGCSVQQAPGSRYSRSAVVKGWALARQEPQVVQSKGAAHTQLRDLAITTDQAVHDLHSRVRFEGPEGTLDQLQKALVDGQAHSIFNGSVQVPQLAQRTDAAQLSRHLLLSERAKVDTKPELEIVADDVRCTHGATVSSLSDEELFYLRSRGIDRLTGAELLRRGFCAEILRELPPLLAQEVA